MFSFNYWNYGLQYWQAEQLCKKYGKGWSVATFNKKLSGEGGIVIRDNNYKLSVEHVQ